MAEPKVYIIVLNYNGSADTIDCLRSLGELTYPNYHVIVVDNCSTDQSETNIRQFLSEQSHIPVDRYTFLKATTNRGYAAGNNIGLRHAQARGDFAYVWIINNDVVVHPGALTALVSRAQAGSSIGLCGSTICDYHQKDLIQLQAGGVYKPLTGTTNHVGENLTVASALPAEEVERTITYISGASVLVTKAFLDKVGLMDENYFLFYEEVDWALRATNKFQLGYSEESFVYHKGGASYTDNSLSVVADFNMIRSRILVTKKFFPGSIVTVYLVILGITLPKRLLRGQWQQFKLIAKLLLRGGQLKLATT